MASILGFDLRNLVSLRPALPPEIAKHRPDTVETFELHQSASEVWHIAPNALKIETLDISRRIRSWVPGKHRRLTASACVRWLWQILQQHMRYRPNFAGRIAPLTGSKRFASVKA